jgi:endopeptidase La
MTTPKKFLLNFLELEYNRYSKLIYNYSDHIEHCYNETIITLVDRNNYLRVLNELIKTMNLLYNEKLKIFEGINKIDNQQDYDNNDEESKKDGNEIITYKQQNKLVKFNYDTIYKINSKSTFDLINLWDGLNITNYKHYYFDDFNKIKNKLLKISEKIGFKKIEDAMNILVCRDFGELLNNCNNKFKIYYEIFNTTFIPLNYSQKSCNNNETISGKIITSDCDIILDRAVEIVITPPLSKISYIFKGYFNNDPLNILIKTSQICSTYVFEKRKELSEFINNYKDNKYISDKFKNNFLKNLNIGEILCYDKNELMTKIENEYEKYIKIIKLPFRNLMSDEYMNDKITIHNQYRIIKLFLLGGSDDNTNMAGLLFGITKDKKLGNEFISNIIYKNLPFTFQSKLKKSTLTLKNEMDKLKNLAVDDVDVTKQLIMNKNMPSYVKKIALEKSHEMKNGGSEYSKQKIYLDVLMNYPWIGESNDDIFRKISGNMKDSRKFLDNVKYILDNKVYGHNDCKHMMKQLIGKWISNPSSIGKAVGLYGPPGVGKTLIAKSLGEALQIPFTQINLGGREDRCELSGHSYTYSSAQPGLIVRKMVEAGKPRCIIYFDELDKACTKHGINEIYNVLIHVTDKNTNDKFSDSFFSEISFPLNQVLFVFSYNDPDKIDKILLDRMEKIEVKPYTITDKVVIVNNYLLKELSEEMGIPNDTINISNSDIEYIIDNYTSEAGVRSLRNKLETLFLNINLDRIYGTGPFKNNNNLKNIFIDKEYIDKSLKKINISDKKIHDIDDIGIINGLYATTNGSGGIIPILIYKNYIGKKNEFILKITGSQGKVMKESVSFSFTTAMNLIKEKYRDEFLKNTQYGLHIHTPDGATPKDGPSAGSAFTTAFVSRILNKKIKKDVAMTGEIDTNGKISAIGGLQYKLKGAEKAGVKTIFIPNENKKDLDEILIKDKNLSTNMNIILVSNIKDVLKYALIEESNNMPFDPEKYLN